MTNEFDAIVIGGGHNGLVSAAYLGRAGLKVLLLEARSSLGGACGTFEFMPGYRSSLANSPGSLERCIVDELELEKFGLEFVQADPTLVHFYSDRSYVNWRDVNRNQDAFEQFAPGEFDRQRALVGALERVAGILGVSVFEAPPPMSEILAAAARAGEEDLLNRVLFGSLRDLLDFSFQSEEAKTLLCMVALNATLTPPSAPGTAVGLMMRPLSLASTPAHEGNDFRKHVLRGSTGLPLGGMGVLVDSLEASCRSSGVEIRTKAPVAKVCHDQDSVTSVVLRSGEEIKASRVISALNPKTFFNDILPLDEIDPDASSRIRSLPMRGSAFKIILGLEALPEYAFLPDGVKTADVVQCQFRIAHSVQYYEDSILDALQGRCSEGPIMWGLFQSVTSPDLAPEGKHLLSVNVWHAPYRLREGNWNDEAYRFGWRCIDILNGYMPGLKERIADYRFMGPADIEQEFGLVESGITHGDMLPGSLLAARPDPAVRNYRGPLDGLYLSGGGVWPGGYVTGVPGRNTSQAVMEDIGSGLGKGKCKWNFL